jgi:uncharacterized protein (DUF1697 family)
MSKYISLLRGVNVGGRKIIMGELQELYESLDLKEVKTYIQSGNVIFKSSDKNISKLRKEIEKEIENTFNFPVSIILMTYDELKKVVENNPYLNEDTRHIYITFLFEFPIDVPYQEMILIKDESEKFSINHRVIYLFLPQGYGRTKLNNNFFERKLGVPATTRNWKTTKRLLELTK